MAKKLEVKTKQNIEAEKAWYDDNPWIKRDCFLMKYPFVNPKRHNYAFDYARNMARKYIQNYLSSKNVKIHKALVAPCGFNADQDILKGMAEEMYGIDISKAALERCPNFIITKEADILQNGYQDNYFDFVASFLFFHHIHLVGFDPYLKEFHRIIKRGGLLFIIEPSSLNPIWNLMNIGRKIFGNISGLVPDERPIRPSRMNDSLIANGFQIQKLASCSFSHVRIPLPIQRVINILSYPLLKLFPFSHMGWLCIWICEKR